MPPDLAQIYDAHGAAVFAFALNLTREEHTARDVVQEVFLRLVRQTKALDGVRELRAWLLRIAHRVIIDFSRRRDAHSRAVEAAAREPAMLFTEAEIPGDDAFRSQVATALAALPEEQRAVVHLKIWEDFTFAEIATALGLSANTAASRYRYALDKLEALLRPLHDECP